MSERKKISVYVSPEISEKIKYLAKKYDMTFSSMGGVALKMGLIGFEIAMDPKMKEVYEKQIEEELDK